jgi:hypothetical protein
MNTGEDTSSSMDLSSSNVGDEISVSLPSDLTVFVIASVCVLIVAFISAFEGLKGERVHLPVLSSLAPLHCELCMH